MNQIPAVTIARHGSGWLVACGKHWEQFAQRRPAADRLAWEHQKTCKEGR